MLLALLTATVVSFTQPVSLTCGASATAQTVAVHGPEEMGAVLKVSTEDDHAKDTHLCMADYKLLLSHKSEPAKEIEVLTSDNDWSRKISIEVSGFTSDGKKVLGIFSEAGSAPIQQVFEYSADDDSVQLFDLRKFAAHLTGTRCLINAQILGTTESGGIVLQLSSGKYCGTVSRWQLTSVNGPLQRLPRHAAVRDLYSQKN